MQNVTIMPFHVVAKPTPGEYVGRPSPLGNPYPLRGENSRNAVCDLYDDWFKLKVEEDDPSVMGELRRLWRLHKETGTVNLQCFCHPKRCHAETIARFLNSFL